MHRITRWQYQYLGLKHFPARFGELEIPFFFTFPPDDLQAIASRFEERHRIGVALQLGFLRMTGCFLNKMPTALPKGLLQHIADQVGLPAPRIATLRSIYNNAKRTMQDHQDWILKHAGFRRMTSKHDGRLLVHLKREAKRKADLNLLTESAMVWMYQRGLLNTGISGLQKAARRAVGQSEHALYLQIMASVTDKQLEVWVKRVTDAHPEEGMTWLEWLATPARKLNINALRDRIARVEFLRNLNVDKVVLPGVALEKIHFYALELKHMRPAKFAELQNDEMRTIRLVCFLRHMLTENTDTAVAMAHRMVRKYWREALEAAKKRDSEVAISARSLINEISHLHKDQNLSREQFWEQVGEVLAKDTTKHFPTRSAAARWILTEKGSPIGPMLREIQRLDLQFSIESPAANAMQMIRGLYGKQHTELPPGTYVKVTRAWRGLLDDPDRARALRALEADTIFAIRKGLRNGSIWIESSGAFRNRNELLISKEEWLAHHRRYYANLDLPRVPNEFLDQMTSLLRKKCEMLAGAVSKGELTIRSGAIQFPKIVAREHPKEWDDAVEALGNKLPIVQLPDVILDVDARAGVTRALLGRQARSEDELLKVYGGLLAHACALDATAVALMVPGLDAEAVRAGQRLFHDADAVRAATEAVSSYHRRFPVARAWGDGRLASADMLAVDVSERLWRSRIDPKRNVPSVGVYTTLSDQLTLIYGQPVLLNERQAGAALESVVRQTEIQVDQLAVDTHGYTDFAFGVGKHLHVDFCPQLKSMRDRKIHLPTSMSPYPAIKEVCNNTIVMRNIRNYWDELVRIAGSIESGHVSATIALARFGSAAQGDPVYGAGVAFGRLCRSLFLCDYYLNDDFRHAIKRILSHGESVHNLQRSIYTGTHSKPRGQHDEDLVALSGSLTLLTNMCLAWNTSRIQALLKEEGNDIPEWIKVMAPGRSAHINFRGTMKFPVRAYADRLIAAGPRRAVG